MKIRYVVLSGSPFPPEDFAAWLLLNHLFIRVICVIRDLIVFRRERGGDSRP